MTIDPAVRTMTGDALSESMGGFRAVRWDAKTRELEATFTVRPAYCHTNGTIAQGGFVTAWLDAAMAHAVFHDTDAGFNLASLEIKVSFFERVGPGPGRVIGRVIRRGKRVAFLEGSLYNAEGQLAAQATSTGMLIPHLKAE